MSSFHSERTVKAVRKACRCDGCRFRIEVGQPAIRWAGVTDGDFGTLVWHPECRQAEIALNQLHSTHWDEWMGLADLDREDWPWLIANYPAIAERRGITLARIQEPSA